MNQREHVLNAALLAVGIGFALEPAGTMVTIEYIATVFVPILLGAMLPDVDLHYGSHRKTLHNLSVLTVFLVYPLYLGNLHWVWLGVLTHYVLDILGTNRGIALFYPLWEMEVEVPVGVNASSPWAALVTIAISALEVWVVYVLVTVAPYTGLTPTLMS